jgi:alpha-D-ribose 1-methylphosphonate 5-triphosphate synthase subunit PhnG
MPTATDQIDRQSGRHALMVVLARAKTGEIEEAVARFEDIPFTELRPAETGLVMLRGRIGGDGAPFNIGEATVTRSAIRLETGETGFGYVLGRDRKKAQLIALCDALWQKDAHRADIERHVLSPLRDVQERAREKARAETAATKVDFFTLVRGED